MKNNKGFASLTILLGVLLVLALGSVAYVAMNPEVMTQVTASVSGNTDDGVQTEPGDHMEVDHDANEGVQADAKLAISWHFETLAEKDGIPQTKVSVSVNGKVHEAGTFQGSCAEVGATGGVDGKGLLAGELAAAQCWYAGGGDEIGIFAHEDGGYEVMVGGLSEGDAETAPFRGDFKIKASIQL